MHRPMAWGISSLFDCRSPALTHSVLWGQLSPLCFKKVHSNRIASPLSRSSTAARRYCFVYTNSLDGVLRVSSSKDYCRRSPGWTAEGTWAFKVNCFLLCKVNCFMNAGVWSVSWGFWTWVASMIRYESLKKIFVTCVFKNKQKFCRSMRRSSDSRSPPGLSQTSRVCDDCQPFHHLAFPSQSLSSFLSLVVILMVQYHISVMTTLIN